jgi:maleylacetoacetate isomerase
MLKLYGYWRSSSAYRVRIALQLKLIDYEAVPVHLLRDGGEQHRPEFRALNPQGRVPLLVDGGFRLSQSLAIFQYLEALAPHPALVPADAQDAARMWALCQTIACDIQPLQNSGVLDYLGGELGLDPARKQAWLQHWIGLGLQALEAMLAERDAAPYCCGDTPTYADCCLIPQLYAARRYGCALDRFPHLLAIDGRCAEHEAFIEARPDLQADKA